MSETKREQLNFENKIKSRKRVQKYRENKKQASNLGTNQLAATTLIPSAASKTGSGSLTHSYKTKSALAKAVTKAKKSLPSSPSKRKIVVSKLLDSFDDKDRDEIVGKQASKQNKKHWKRMSTDLIENIEAFYERDEISRISPNVKDARYFKNAVTGQKELRQLRYLTYKLKEVRAFFVKEYASMT